MTALPDRAGLRWAQFEWEADGRTVVAVAPDEMHGPIRTTIARSMVHADGLPEYIVALHNASRAALAATGDSSPDRAGLRPLTGEEETALWNFYVHRTLHRLDADLRPSESIARLLVTLDATRSALLAATEPRLDDSLNDEYPFVAGVNVVEADHDR